MCGIFGVIGKNLDHSSLLTATRLLTHRGPDGEGYKSFDDNVFLGHTRLSVQDLSLNGKQPMSSEDGRFWITYNGEIYNFLKLRNNLENIGYKFKSRTDTEVILHQYALKGEKCLEDLDGMFAFAIYDKQEQKIFLARDRVGIKPLYYAHDNGRFAFSSEIKAILASNLFPKEMNLQAVYDYFTFLYVPCPQTGFLNIQQLSPGHSLTYDIKNNNVKLTKYWDISRNNSNASSLEMSYGELKYKLLTLLEDSVKSQLVSDVPLGLHLSGGIDSSIIAALASKHIDKKLKTFTVVFQGEENKYYDESENARVVSNYLNTEHSEISINLTNPEEVLDLTHSFDQPFGNPTSYLYYLISKFTKNHVTVALSGAGGDELFAGYPRYKVLHYSKLLSLFPKYLNPLLMNAAKCIKESNSNPLPRRMKLFLRGIGEKLPEQYLRWTYYMDDNQKNNLLSLLSEKENLQPSSRLINNYINSFKCKDLINTCEYVDLHTFLLDNVLEYTDKTSMAASLEVRVPFLDHKIVEFSLQLPSKYKIYKGQSKYILKDTFRNYLPENILKSPKKGFCAPMATWINKHFDFYFDKLLTKEYLLKQRIFDWEFIQLLRFEHKKQMVDNSMELFGIIMFDVWYRKYFN